jgi:hypothetical protein
VKLFGLTIPFAGKQKATEGEYRPGPYRARRRLAFRVGG